MNQITLPDETLDISEGVKIIQKKKGHRFTTDSILLAKFSIPKRYARVLELGTGCGVVAIILAKQHPTINIIAAEIQKEMAELATRNVFLNDMESHITVLNKDIKELPQILPSAYFDYIVTNPPYRHPSSGRTSPDLKRAISSQEFAVTINDIMKVSQHLLKVRGRISLIYTADRLVDLLSVMRTYRIEPKQMKCIPTRKDGEIRLVWVEGIKEGRPGLNVSGLP